MATNDILQRPQRCFHWMAHVRLSRIVISLLIFLIIVPLITHYYVSNLSKDSDSDAYHSRSKLDHPEDVDDLEISKLKQQIEDLKKTKASVNNELRDLDSKRQKIQVDISDYSLQVDLLKTRFDSLNKDVTQTQLTLEQLKLQKDEMMRNYIPEIKAPQKIIANVNSSDIIPPPHSSHFCKMYSCFDYSQCSLFSGFPVYFYNTEGLALNSFTKQSFMSVISTNAYVTKNPSEACIYIVLIGEQIYSLSSAKSIQTYLQNLSFWKGDGRNHVLVNLARTAKNLDLFVGVRTGRAIVTQSSFIETHFRQGFDIVLPPNLGIISGETWQNLPPLSPVLRKYLLSFQGKFHGAISTADNENKNIDKGALFDDLESQESDIQVDLRNFHKEEFQGRKLTSLFASYDALISREVSIVSTLKMMTASQDSFSLNFLCESENSIGTNGEWALCNNEQERSDILRQSTFSLLIAPVNYSVISSSVFQIRLYESLKYGAIPVILGDSVVLPFEEIIDWHQAVIRISKSRVTELHFLIKSYTEVDIGELRRNCRLIWQAFFSTTSAIFDSVLGTVRIRLKIPAVPVVDTQGKSLFNSSFPYLKLDGPDPEPETDEVLGPIEQRFPSPTFQHNFSAFQLADDFRRAADPFHLYPFTPFDKQLPSESKFFGSGYGYRPIGKGAGGAGKEFSTALGGNQRREQFTIVMLTYEREAVLISALQRLKGLPFLNKVIVVWNSPKMPSEDLRWPEIGIPILVVKASKNSLNNRFLPFAEIETEAVLSIDDDAHLRHDEIVFGFRVWREERDRIVGFPGRFHAFDLSANAWLYNSNYSCELSMVLTGAAFYHKYYAYLYSNWMPQSIRDKVDEYLNCEDIAMNFLVSHVTRKPPLKVTSRWTFRCPGCPALSNETSHFEERHKCINFFVKVYGYMPLLYTQYRADSVLFKTRLPHTKQKCFRFI